MCQGQRGTLCKRHRRVRDRNVRVSEQEVNLLVRMEEDERRARAGEREWDRMVEHEEEFLKEEGQITVDR